MAALFRYIPTKKVIQLSRNNVVFAMFFILFSANLVFADYNAFSASGASSIAGASSVAYTFILNMTTDYSNLTNLTVIFPAGFGVSGASISPISNFTASGNTSISSQNVSFAFPSSNIVAGQNISFQINGIINANTTGTYSFQAVAFNGTSTDNQSESGLSSSISILPSTIAFVYANISAYSRIAGTNLTINLTSKDRFGNVVNDTYNFSISDAQGILPLNNSPNNSIKNVTFKTMGNQTLIAISQSNASAINTSYILVNSSTVAFVYAYYSKPVVVSGENFTANFTSKDLYGNIVPDTYNFTTADGNASVILPIDESANSTNLNFSLATYGISHINATSNSNSSAKNTTLMPVNARHVAYIQVGLSNTSVMANSTITATISSFDSQNQSVNDAYLFSTSASIAVLPSAGTANGTTTIRLVSFGNNTFTVASMDNSSAINISYIVVNATAVVTLILSPISPTLTVGVSDQFSAILKDQFGNTNSTVTANFNLTAISGTATISSNGLFNSTVAGLITVSANYSGIWNSTNVTVSAAASTPTPTTSQTTQSNVQSTPQPNYQVPTPQPRNIPTPTPSPTPTRKAIIEATPAPSPTPAPKLTEYNSELSALNADILKLKGLEIEPTEEINSLILTAKELAATNNYEGATLKIKEARQKIAALIAQDPAEENLKLVTKKGGMNWLLIALIIIVAGVGVFSYIHFASKEQAKFRKAKAEAELSVKVESDDKTGKRGKLKGEFDPVD